MNRIFVGSLAFSLLGATSLAAQQTPARAGAQGQQPQQQNARPAGAQQQPGQRPAPQPPAAGPGVIRGSVVDAESNARVASASVSVRTASGTLVAGALARADGSFVVNGLRPGTYSVRVSMMGYQPHTESVTITDAAPTVNAGAVRLARGGVALAGITATATRSAAIVAPDRTTYSSRTVAPAATSASEVLEAVPSVQVDADGKVSLRGNENVVVQINGRPSPLHGDQLAAYLRQLPANTLDRVEVMPNPSAKQDPEGMAGIINIVLKQNVDLGLSGGLTLSSSTNDRYTASGNLGYQKGPATWFGSYGFISDGRDVRGINDRTRLGALQAPTSFTNQDITERTGNTGHNFNGSLDYRLGPKNTLSTSVLYNARNGSDNSLSAYSELNGSETLLDQYDRIRNDDSDSRMADGALDFKRVITPQRNELSAEVRYNRVRDFDQADLWRQAVGGGSTADAEIDRTTAVTRQLTAQLDYTRAFGARGKLETGYKGYSRWLDRDYTVLTDPLGTGTFARSDLSNALSLDERVDAAYAVLSQGVGKWDLQGGLRAEYASRDFTLASTGQRYPHGYASLFPSGVASLKVGNNDQLKLSYSRRIRRPGTQELNPFPVFFDVQNVFLGNPRLNPEYTDAIELGWQHSARLGSLSVAPFYRRTTDVIRFIVNTADTVNGREVTSVSFENLDHGTSWGTDVNASARLGQAFNGFAAFNVYKMVTEGSGNASSLASSAVSWSVRMNGTMNLSPKTAVTAQWFYRAPFNIERGRFASQSMANLSIRQKLNGDKSSLTVRVADPFNAMRFRVQAGDDHVIQLTERTFNARALFVTFQTTFGHPPRLRQRPQDQPQPSAPTPFGG